MSPKQLEAFDHLGYNIPRFEYKVEGDKILLCVGQVRELGCRKPWRIMSLKGLQYVEVDR